MWFLKILLCLLLIITKQAIAQQTYYVSPTGDDFSLTPTNINTPWKTFNKACNTAMAGDKVFFRGGIYSEKYINFVNSGLPNNYIQFENYAAEIPIFKGGNVAAYFIFIENKNYIKIKGLQFRQLLGANSVGIKVTGSSHHIQITKCKISELYFSSNALAVPTPSENVSPLVFCGSDNINAINNILVDSCEISNCRTGYTEALTLVGNVTDFVVSNNRINNTGNIGIVAAGFYNWCNASPLYAQARNGFIKGNIVENCRSLAAIAAGIYVDGGRNIVVEQNIAKNGQRGFQINCENQYNIAGASADSVIVRNNLSFNNSRGGIGLGTQGSGNVKNSWILNNTCYNNFKAQTEPGDGGVFQDFGEINLDKSSNCTVSNNIFYSAIGGRSKMMNSYPISPIVNLNTNYNVWFDEFDGLPYFVYNGIAFLGLQAFKTGTNKDTNSKFSNPDFTNLPLLDFRLSSETSPAYDFSNPESIFLEKTGFKDFAKKERIKNFLADAGALELQCINTDILINTPLTNNNYFFETSGKITINVPINTNSKIYINASKYVLFENGFNSLQNVVLVTKLDGCNSNN
jgi:hypothetical protein